MKFTSIKRSRIFGQAIIIALLFSAVGPRVLRVAAAGSTNQQPVAFNTSMTVQQGNFECDTANGGCGGTSYTVPQGKLLVVQQLMATTINFSNNLAQPGAFMFIDRNLTFPIVLSQQNDNNFGTNLVAGTAYDFAGSQQVTIYLNAGETVDFLASRFNTGGNEQCNFFFYGYLVDAP